MAINIWVLSMCKNRLSLSVKRDVTGIYKRLQIAIGWLITHMFWLVLLDTLISKRIWLTNKESSWREGHEIEKTVQLHENHLPSRQLHKWAGKQINGLIREMRKTKGNISAFITEPSLTVIKSQSSKSSIYQLAS